LSGTGSPQISAQPATDSAGWKGFNDPLLEQLILLAYRQNLTLARSCFSGSAVTEGEEVRILCSDWPRQSELARKDPLM
jgi:hypothetical protein